MDTATMEKKIAGLIDEEPRYEAAAYRFVADAVTFTVDRLGSHRHVSARELLAGVREYAKQQYGVLAEEVLGSWGLRSANDVGTVVYLLIGVGLLAASPDDHPEDFNCDFQLFDALAEKESSAGTKKALPKID